MGFLTAGQPLSWQEAQEFLDVVRMKGIDQLVLIFKHLANRRGDCLKWGDEVEMLLLELDDKEHRARVSLESEHLLEKLNEEELNAKEGTILETLWRPEYGSYMIEGTPGHPYGGESDAFLLVEQNMRLRRRQVKSFLQPSQRLLTVTNFFHLGVGDFTIPATQPGGPVAESLFFSDALINHHPRFPTMTRNIKDRRGKKVEIHAPIFRDTNTDPQIKDIYMDGQVFGMGMCCLQVTFQASSLDEARRVYDPLVVLSPVLLALTAATPVFRGYLSDDDVRWFVISQSVDDRRDEEKKVVKKSRYDSVSYYIGPDVPAGMNDLDLVFNKSVEERLLHEGFPEPLARHFAHLFIRDPLVIFRDRIDLDPEKHSDHFENIQSTNWQTIRFKPPPPQSGIGWRVEFRPMEVQFTDFENAAFTVFIVLVTRVILTYGVDIYIPLSHVDANMQRARMRDAVRGQRFFWKGSSDCSNCCGSNAASSSASGSHEELTVDEIINGRLLPLIRGYLGSIVIELETRLVVDGYLELISKRASGALDTNAAFIRKFVQTHPEYKHDSVVTERICYDLVTAIGTLENGDKEPSPSSSSSSVSSSARDQQVAALLAKLGNMSQTLETRRHFGH